MSSLHQNPYQPPQTDLGDREIPQKGRAMAITGLILNLGVVLGIFISVRIMISFYSGPGMGEEGYEGIMAEMISRTITIVIILLASGLLGVILMGISLLKAKLRARWFFVQGLIVAGIWCIFVFPLGLVPGIVVLVLFLTRTAEFFPRKSATSSAIGDSPAG